VYPGFRGKEAMKNVFLIPALQSSKY